MINDNYRSKWSDILNKPYIPLKADDGIMMPVDVQQNRTVAVYAANGNNGFSTLDLLCREHETLDAVYGIVRKDEYKNPIKAKLRASREAQHVQNALNPILLTEEEAKQSGILSEVGVLVNWAGVNLKSVKDRHPDYREHAESIGFHPRDLTGEQNFQIAGNVAEMFGDNQGIFLQQANPVDSCIKYLVEECGLDPRRTTSTSTGMEEYRWLKLLSDDLNITMENASCVFLGEHGAEAVPIRGGLRLNGIPIGNCIGNSDSVDMYLSDLYGAVMDEARWILDTTKETPSIGPAGLTRDFILRFFHPQKGEVCRGACYALADSDVGRHYGIQSDTALSLPILVDRYGIRPLKIDLTDEERNLVSHAGEHIKNVKDWVVGEIAKAV